MSGHSTSGPRDCCIAAFCLVSALLLCSGPARAAEGPSATEARELAVQLDQARLFWRRGWKDDAWAELVLALQSPAGRLDHEAHRLAADWAWQRRDVRAALDMALAAERLAPDSATRSEDAALALSYERGFGFLTVEGPYPRMRARLDLSRDSLLLNPDHKRYVEALRGDLSSRQPLPVQLGLPVGSYRINGQPVEIVAGQNPELVLPLDAMGARGSRRLQASRLEVASGVGLYLGAGAEGLLPFPTLQGSFLLPFGPLLLGPTAELSRPSWRGPDDALRHRPLAWATGLRLGAEVPTELPLALRASLLLRVGTVPGVALSCNQDSAGLTCALPVENEAPDALLHAVALAFLPGAELAIETRQEGRDRAVGAGLRVAWEQVLGRFPEGVAAAWDSDAGPAAPWTAEGTRWRAQGLRVMAGLSFAF